MTVASPWPGFTVKTRQQPSEACVATRTSVTPAGATLGFGDVPASLSIADEVQAWSETDITKQGIANRRILSMPDESSGNEKQVLHGRKPGDELEPPEAAVVRAVNASVGRAERGVRAVVQRVKAIGVDVIVEPLWESGAASLERAAREIRRGRRRPGRPEALPRRRGASDPRRPPPLANSGRRVRRCATTRSRPVGAGREPSGAGRQDEAVAVATWCTSASISIVGFQVAPLSPV